MSPGRRALSSTPTQLSADKRNKGHFPKRAFALIEKNEIYISKTVLLETEWVLRHAYRIDTNTIISGFHKLLGLPQVVIEDSWIAFQALSWHAEGLDFADALHLASCPKAASFAKQIL
jgi:predicted nucleic-acid-binding protein